MVLISELNDTPFNLKVLINDLCACVCPLIFAHHVDTLA